MSNFDDAFHVVLGHEGGFSDHRADPGGATNYGISLRYLLARGDLDHDGLPDGDVDGDGDVDVDDIRALSPLDAKHLYHTGFWTPNRLGEVRDQTIATKIFDMCVNMGSRQAWRLVQRACNDHGGHLEDDGVVGPKTLHAVNAFADDDESPDGPSLLGLIRIQQAEFYEQLVANRPSLEPFLQGWRNRAMA